MNDYEGSADRRQAATVVLQKPHGTGRFIHALQAEDVETEQVIVPEEGMKTLELWLRSAAVYLKGRLLGFEQLNTVEQVNSVYDGVRHDLQVRADLGTKKYGEALRANNGRDAEVDAYQEVLDGWAYTRQKREEQESPKVMK